MVRYDFPANTNSQGRNPKVDRSEYIEASLETFDSEITADMSAEIELEMAETLYDMKREFKRQNKKIRKFYSSKEPKKMFYEPNKPAKIQRLSKRHAAA